MLTSTKTILAVAAVAGLPSVAVAQVRAAAAWPASQTQAGAQDPHLALPVRLAWGPVSAAPRAEFVVPHAALAASPAPVLVADAGAMTGELLQSGSAQAGSTQASPAGAQAQMPVTTRRRDSVPRQFGTARPASSAPQAQATSQASEQILLEADAVEQQPDTDVIVASGNVIARNAGRTLRADRLTYDRATGIVTASGQVSVVEADGNTSFADQLTVDDELTAGVVQGFALRLPDNAVLAANSAVRREGQRVVLSQMVYTACKICEDGSRPPTWTIRARQALQSVPDKTITYNDMVFEVAGRPVLWLPWFRHPDPSAERQSGFLQPTPGRSGRYGYNLAVPYQFVLDEHSDLTVTPTVYQFINPMVQADWRRALHSGDVRLQGTLTYESLFRRLGRNVGDKDWRGSLFGQGLFAINDTWRWGFGIENAGDDTYLQRYDLDGAGTQRGLVRAQFSRLISQLFVAGQTDTFYGRALSLNFQELQGASRRKEPPIVLPLVEATRSFTIGPMGGRADVFGSALRLDRREGRLDSSRVSAGGRWRWQTIMGPGIVVEPQLFARSDWFSYDNASLNAGATQSFARTVGLVSLDLRWPLQRVDRGATWTIEPRLLVSIASEDKDRARIFNEDSIGFEFDATTQFRPNAAAGSDFWDGGASVTAGITLGAQVGDQTSVRWFVGTRRRETDRPSPDRVTNLGRQQGDIVSDLDVAWGTGFNLAARTRFDSDSGSLVRAEVQASLNRGPLSLVTRYHHLPEKFTTADRANHEVYAQASWRINSSWSVLVGGTRDILRERNLREAWGVSWEDDCTQVRLLFDRTKFVNRFIEPTTNVRLEFAFRTLGLLDPDPLN